MRQEDAADPEAGLERVVRFRAAGFRADKH